MSPSTIKNLASYDGAIAELTKIDQQKRIIRNHLHSIKLFDLELIIIMVKVPCSLIAFSAKKLVAPPRFP